ncbi:titin-like [Scomber scombrus]|uniref:titin-like n=1 Tax=Scomber scombrus TaxID=13677 RepID=UPI002DDC862B|nr:titin-like [Scomber scombrus]
MDSNNKYYILAFVGVVVGVAALLLWPTDDAGTGSQNIQDLKSLIPGESFKGKVKVYSKVTGQTFGAHQVLLDKVKSMSRSVTVETTEDLHESHVVIAFCPITSRVGSDVEAAMTDITGSCGQKPVILVLMHHTRDVEYSTEGRRWSDLYHSVVLDVHVLFHETKSGLLMCPKNDQAAGRLQQELQKHADKNRLNIQENHEGSKSESGGRDQQEMDFNNNKYYILVLIVGVVVGIVVYRLLLRPTEEEARFIKNLSNVEGAEMDSVKLICEVSKPSADVTWYKGDEELPEGGRYDQIVDGKRRILLIQNLKMDDAGEYYCKLSPSITTSGNLKINELVAEFISKPHNQEVGKGEKAEFTFFISKENYQVRWMKDEKELEEGDKYQIISDGKRRTLYIRNCDPKDEGGYVVMIGPNEASVNLTVEEEARFIKNLSNVEGAEMDSVKLICEVSKPSADVTWYKGDEELPEGGRYDQMVDGKRRILLIQNLKMDDAGEYYCKLSPSITTSGNLKINELAAEFISKPHNQEVVEGEKAEFTFFISKENYQVRWMKDEKELEEGDKYQMISDGKRRTLVIRNCDPKDEGGYVVMIGPNGASVNLTIEEEARFIKNLSNVEGAEMDSVKLICEVSKPSADVTWYKGDEELPEGGRYDQMVDGKRRILLIQNLKMEDAGEYYCKLSPSITISGNLKINELAAEFISKPHNQEVGKGEKAEFTFFISKENYQVRWMKDEKELEEGDKYQMISDGKRRTLVIKNCDPKDEGGYVVMIGPNGASVNLTVEEEARFIKNLSNVEGAEMDSVKLICEVSKPSADVTWYKGDEELPEGGRYDQMVDGKRRILLIQNLKMDDAGEYYCKLSPSITTSGNLKINELAAEFISKPHNQEVVEGEKAEFTCFISKENYQVRWMKDEKELEEGDKYQIISDGKRRTLVIKDCDPKDEGGYVVMIGPNEASVNLTVEEEARFIKNLSNVEGAEMDSVKLICEVSKPSADVTWYKGDEELPEGGRYDQMVDGKRRILLIQNLKMDDAGEYYCKLSPSITTSGNLTINELAAEFISKPHNQEVGEGEKAEFTFFISKENYQVRWMKDEKELEEGDKYQMISDGKRRTLYIRNCDPKDEGGYVVMIGPNGASVNLTVEEEARFIKNLSNVEGAEMDSVKLICEVSKPSADVTWYKGDEELPEGGRYDQMVDGKRRILLIQNLKMDDAGEYYCKLSPSITISGNLTINELAAEFISKPHNQEVVEGEKAEFTCFISKENYQVRWMKDEKELEEGDKYQIISDGKRRTLVIKDCDPKDEGGYVVMIGPNGASVNLTVEEEARFIKNLSNVEGAEMDSVKLICEVSKPSADVTWYKGDEELPEGGRYDQMVDGKRRILLIQNLKMDDAGEYYCKLSPSITTSGNLKINELAAEFISKPHNQEVVEGEKAEFTCFISKENYQVRWMKDEKELEEGDKYQMISDGKRRTLVIKNCDPKDEGGYVVMIGPNGASVNLTIGKRSS